MEEERNQWEEALRMAEANFGEVVEENNSAAEPEKPVRTCGWVVFFLLFFTGCSPQTFTS